MFYYYFRKGIGQQSNAVAAYFFFRSVKFSSFIFSLFLHSGLVFLYFLFMSKDNNVEKLLCLKTQTLGKILKIKIDAKCLMVNSTTVKDI